MTFRNPFRIFLRKGGATGGHVVFPIEPSGIEWGLTWKQSSGTRSMDLLTMPPEGVSRQLLAAVETEALMGPKITKDYKSGKNTMLINSDQSSRLLLVTSRSILISRSVVLGRQGSVRIFDYLGLPTTTPILDQSASMLLIKILNEKWAHAQALVTYFVLVAPSFNTQMAPSGKVLISSVTTLVLVFYR